MSNFAEELISLNIYDKLDTNIANDPDQNYEKFAEAINYARQEHLPKKKVKYKKSIHKKSKWITNGILKSINTKDKLYKTLIQTNTTTNMDLYHRLKEEFKQYRAKLQKSIREAKRQYFSNIFNRHKSDIRKTWCLLNETLNRNVKKQPTHEFLVDNIMTTDPVIIANKFNEYFINIGNSLADKIPTAEPFHSYLKYPTNYVFTFQPITEVKISEFIGNLKNKSSYGHGCLSNVMIKKAQGPLIKPARTLRSASTTSLVPNKNKTVMLGRRLIDTTSAALWNNLPNDIKFARNIIHFKKLLKPFITSNF